MSQFSTLLKEYTVKKGYTIKTLSEMCGVERTYLHKILKGERKPPNTDFVNEICRQLMLTAEEKSELMERYNIAVMGEDVYMRRSRVGEIISSMANCGSNSKKGIDFKTEIDYDSVPEVSSYSDGKEFYKNIQILMSCDVQNGSDIRVIAQPSELLNSMLSYCVEGADVSVYHLFCFDNNACESNSNKYNLGIFPFICDMAMAYERYKPFYYYDQALSHINSMSLMPYVLITDNFVICSDEKFSRGMIYKSHKAVDFYIGQFERLRSECMSLLNSASSLVEIAQFWYEDAEFLVSFDYQPCSMTGITEEIYNAHAKVPEEMKPIISGVLLKGQSNYKKIRFVNFFSEKGLAEFIETGEIFELPAGTYTRPTLAERKIILQNMIAVCQNGGCEYRVIKDDRLASTKNLCINVAGQKKLKIVARADSFSDFSYLSINERSLIYAFGDYFKYLLESDFVASKEETVEIMKKYL